MLPFFRNDRPSIKLQATHGSLLSHIDPSQPPRKRKPFSSLWALRHAHALDVILPTEIVDKVVSGLHNQLSKASHDSNSSDAAREAIPKYAKVTMSLAQVVSGEFFTAYIKAGDVLMLSGGRQGVDEVCVLSDGILTIEIDKPTYERCGIAGRAIADGGRKHVKSRYLIEANLRLPSMLHGKRGFDRLVWAFKNVLDQPKTWLFYDRAAKNPDAATAGPIQSFHPQWFALEPTKQRVDSVRVPLFPCAEGNASQAGHASPYAADPEFTADLYEWLALVAAGSPRVRAEDGVDPYLCRYALPEAPGEGTGGENGVVRDLVRLRWSGLMPAAFVFAVFVAAHNAVRDAKARKRRKEDGPVDEMDVDGVEEEHPHKWAALMVHGFRDEHLALLLSGGGAEFVEWTHQGRL